MGATSPGAGTYTGDGVGSGTDAISGGDGAGGPGGGPPGGGAGGSGRYGQRPGNSAGKLGSTWPVIASGRVSLGSPPWPVRGDGTGNAGVPGWPVCGSVRCDGSNVAGSNPRSENAASTNGWTNWPGNRFTTYALKKGPEETDSPSDIG